ncbi:MAG: hypothetical protein ACRDF0_09400 [Candidatus Limnocylindria bacterium]
MRERLHYLFSARAKLERADEHVDTLRSEMKAFAEPYPIEIEYVREAGGARHVLRLRVIKEPPFLRWSLLVGDCLFNLRAVLDHAIYGCVARRTRQVPPPDEDVLAFPITDSPENFAKSIRRLGALQSEGWFVAAVAGLQPFNRGDGTNLPALWLLHQLNNADKHRLVRIIRAMSRTGEVNFRNISPGAYRIRSEVFGSGSLKDGTDIAAFTFDPAAPDAEVDFEVVFAPVIEHPPGPDGRTRSDVDWLLKYIRDEVAHAVDAIDAAWTLR